MVHSGYQVSVLKRSATNRRDTNPVTTYLRLLGLLMYLTKSRPDIMTAVSFGATKSISPTQDDYNNQLYYIVEYIRATADKGHSIPAIQLYCEVDASYLIHSDSKGHTGYKMGLHPNGTFYNRSAKQTLEFHAEMHALYTLVKQGHIQDLNDDIQHSKHCK